MSRAGLCYSYEKNAQCRFGDTCRFVHSMAALKRAGKALGGMPMSGETPSGDPAPQQGGGGGGGGAPTGRGRSNRGRPRRSKKSAAGPKDYECYRWRDTGVCEYGAECRFVHSTRGARRLAEASAGAPSGNATMKTAGQAGSTNASGTSNVAKKKARRSRKKGTAKSAGGNAGENAGAGPMGGAGTGDDEAKGPSKKYLRNQEFIAKKRVFRRRRAARRAAARAAGIGGQNQCFQFRDKGECKFGEECRFRHGDDDDRPLPQRRPRRPRKGADGAEDDSKEAPPVEKVDDICYQFYFTKKCAYGDDCRFQHAVEKADSETVAILDEAKKEMQAKAAQGDADGDGPGTGDAGAPPGTTTTKTTDDGSGAAEASSAMASSKAVENVDGGDVKEAEAPADSGGASTEAVTAGGPQSESDSV